ncbi:MAG: thioredoxin-disulfide reductase [Opitutae bacterium]|nr:thioredoxin-disulfide reductase [Opitutae bacterium]MCD8298578.1 thioredoxin-disulfide reductase [Opitutae bacterium]
MEEIAIIGSGCAGATAAIYAARAGLAPLVIEGKLPGGLITTTAEVENFPGFPDGIDGFSLTLNMRQQAEKFGARFVADEIVAVDFSAVTKRLTAASGKVYEAKSVIVATGAKPRLTGVPGESEFYGGNGVSTCATCDGAFYRGKKVAVFGGGDSACEEANFLTRFAEKVFLMHRREKFRASDVMVRRIVANPKIEIVVPVIPERFVGDDSGRVRAAVVRDVATGEVREIEVAGIFVAIGHEPDTKFLAGALAMEPDGTLVAGGASGVATNVAGVFVAGDCADRVYRQAITAAGMGARAALEAQRYLEALS